MWTGPRDSRSSLRRTEQALLQCIDGARESIWLVAFAAYRIPTIAAALSRAAARGVKLRCVVEDHDESAGKVSFDPLPAIVGNESTATEVYVWPLAKRPRDERGRHGTLHAKALIVDDETAFVSSANYTEDAFVLNIELGLLVRDIPVARQIVGQIEGLIRQGDLVAR